MRITTISVTGLYGIFDHRVSLGSPEGVTLIHGPNGFGKTVLLKMTAALVEGSTTIFEHTPFTEFCLTLEDGTARIIRRHVEHHADEAKGKVTLEFLTRDAAGREVVSSRSPLATEIPKAVLDRVDRYVPNLRRWRRGWRDDVGNEYSLEWVLDRYPAARNALPQKYRPKFFPADLQVFFVESNRLGAEQDPSPTPAEYEAFVFGSAHLQRPRISLRVEQYSGDVLQRIKSVLADYARHSQERDRTFPERLLSTMRAVDAGASAMNPQEIVATMDRLERQRERLIHLGFLDRESGLVDLSINDVERAPEALTIYVGDVQQKLRVFDDLAERIGKLMDVVNGRFQYKSLAIDRSKGFSVLSQAGDTVRLDDLSSGEQHELVLLYELLFRVPRNGLVLVDEPEISLHVAWQARFLPDLIEILQLTGAYALVATHSPVIIGERQDLAIELKGPDRQG
jgi:predicted ATPase